MTIHWVVATIDVGDPDAPTHLTINGYSLWTVEVAEEAFQSWGLPAKEGDMLTVTDTHDDPAWSETRIFIGGQWEFTRMTCKAPPHAAPEAKRDEVQPELLNKRVREW